MQELSLKDIYDASSLKCCKVTCKVIVTVLSNIFLFKIIYLFLTILDLCFCIGLSLVVTSEDYSPLWCTGFLLWWLLLLQSMGSRHTGFHSSSCGSVVAARRLSCFAARVIFLDQGLTQYPLQWRVDP